MDEKKIDDLVAMIDGFMSRNGGHMNVTVADNGDIQTDETTVGVTTMNSLDCQGGNMACCVPTLFEGMDDAEAEMGESGEYDD